MGFPHLDQKTEDQVSVSFIAMLPGPAQRPLPQSLSEPHQNPWRRGDLGEPPQSPDSGVLAHLTKQAHPAQDGAKPKGHPQLRTQRNTLISSFNALIKASDPAPR